MVHDELAATSFMAFQYRIAIAMLLAEKAEQNQTVGRLQYEVKQTKAAAAHLQGFSPATRSSRWSRNRGKLSRAWLGWITWRQC